LQNPAYATDIRLRIAYRLSARNLLVELFGKVAFAKNNQGILTV